MTLKHKLTAAAATGSLMAATLLPGAVFAQDGTTVDVSDNGANSNNKVKVSNNNSNTIEQKNKTVVTTVVSAKANTGKNSASHNTGGDNTIDTGAASNTVTVAVEGGSNTAELPCECIEGDTEVNVRSNGDDSRNRVRVRNNNTNTVKQKNKTYVTTVAELKANSGKNKAKYNTNGNNDITTDDADNTLEVGVGGSTNEL